MTIKLPNQPLHLDQNGVERFVANPIVEYLLKSGGIDMNRIAIWCIENDINFEFKAQFAQLIGYSLDGWGTLSYVTDDKWDSVAPREYQDDD